jgi:hypothetical protein
VSARRKNIKTQEIHAILMGSYLYFYYGKFPPFLQWLRFDDLNFQVGHSPGLKKDQAMNEKEKIEAYIATCKCCMLAQIMKNCPLCRFNIGLAEEVNLVDSIPVPIQTQIAIFAMSE